MTTTSVAIARAPDARTARMLLREQRVFTEGLIGADLLTVQPEAAAEYSRPLVVYAPPRGALALARVDGLGAGVAGVLLKGDGAAELKRMYVRPAFRGLGLGHALLYRALDAARRLGAQRIVLDTWPRHQGTAFALYQAAGFRTVGPAPGWGVDGAIVMALELGGAQRLAA